MTDYVNSTTGEPVADTKAPAGPIHERWDKRRFEAKLVNPANRRKHTVIVVGTGLGGGCARRPPARPPGLATWVYPPRPPHPHLSGAPPPPAAGSAASSTRPPASPTSVRAHAPMTRLSMPRC
jgi:hypothetical protein